MGIKGRVISIIILSVATIVVGTLSWLNIIPYFILALHFIISIAIYAYLIIEILNAHKVLNKEIDKYREINLEMSEENERMERALDDMTAFAYIVSHDLQTPITTLRGFVEIIYKRYGDKLDDEAREFLDIILHESDVITRKIDGLLEFSRVDKSESFEEVDLNEVIDGVLVTLNGDVADIDIDDLPVVYGDYAQLETVLQNLIGNAIKYCPKDNLRINITHYANEEEDVICVRDNGPGVPHELHFRIFDMFYRVPTDKPGDGMGLAISKRIAERHGGRIWVSSPTNRGSNFCFTISKKK